MAVPPLRALVEAGHDVALVVSGADKRRGRGKELSPSPVKAAALELGLPVTSRVDDILALDPSPELGVVVAFGRLIKPHALEAVPMVNLHFSLLPRWRGAAPVERAILAGDDRTGVCVMEVVDELDAGGVYRCVEVPIGPDETAEELRRSLVEVGTPLLVETVTNGPGEAVPQVGEPTYAHKMEPTDLKVDWSSPASYVHRQVRVGGAWTTFHGKRLKVWRTALTPTGKGVVVPAGDGAIEVLEVQPEGKGHMPATAWANGVHWTDADRLGT